MPDVPVTKCESCNRVFHTDDFELQLLQKESCPFCRTPPPHFVAGGGGAGQGSPSPPPPKPALATSGSGGKASSVGGSNASIRWP